MTAQFVRKLFGWPMTLAIFFALQALLLGGTFGGRLEGWLYPVVSATHITQTEPVDEYSTRIWGEANKIRDCAFVSISWYIGTPESHALVAMNIEERSNLRPAENFSFGPWVVKLTPDELRDHSFAKTLHQCHPFWLTESRFYP